MMIQRNEMDSERRQPIDFRAARTRALSAALATGWLLAACGGDEIAPPAAQTAPPVMVETVQVRDVVDRIEATGQLVAKAEATVAAQVAGQVTSIAVEEGDSVEAGQVLLEIDPERRNLEVADAQARLSEARANVAEGKREVERIQGLRKRDAVSQAQLDEVVTRLSLARSREAGAEAQLGLAQRAQADATIRAPFAGLVGRRHANVGEYLSVGVPLFEIVALDPIEVEFSVPEIDSSRVAVGNEIEISVVPYPDERFAARVTVVAPTIDRSTRTLRVKGELANPDARLRPGLFAHVGVGVAHRKGVLMVSESAIVQRAEGSVLYRLVEGNRVERLVVQPGTQEGEYVEVRGGLVPGDRVVVRGQRDLIDGGVVSLRTTEGRPVDGPQVAAPSHGAAPAELAPGAGR
jgi:membrane fusion protein (multidrug efflux system)